MAARLLLRRWPLYLLVLLVVFALQALFYAFVHVKFADMYAALIGPPLVTVVVTVFCGADANGTLPTAGARWERILERAWAVILLDVGISFAILAGEQSMMLTGDAGDILLGILTVFLSAMLVYAEPFACLSEEVRTLTLVPFALLRSMTLAWVDMSRIFALFALQLVLQIVLEFVQQVLTHNRMQSAVPWVEMALGTLITAPLAALFAVAYLDTVAQERRALR